MVTEILWGDGTSDKIYLTYTAASGSQTVLVSSDANAGPARTKDITFVSSVGNISRVLTVTQETNMDYVSITWNDTCITFNDTGIAYPYEEDYIVFADPNVEAICASNWGDGTGLKPSQAAQVTNAQFGTTFRGNTDIETFSELEYFTGITQLASNAFNGCTALQEIKIPSTVTTINSYAFRYCSSLSGPLDIPSSVTTIGESAFDGCNAFSGRMTVPSSVTSTGRNVFNYLGSDGNGVDLYYYSTVTPTTNGFFSRAKIRKLVIGEGVTYIVGSLFRAWTNDAKVLEYVDLPSTISEIKDAAFYGQPLTTFIIRATTPPSVANVAALNSGAFTACYVPYSGDHSVLAAYQTANIWSNYASKIQELNPDGTIPT